MTVSPPPDPTPPQRRVPPRPATRTPQPVDAPATLPRHGSTTRHAPPEPTLPRTRKSRRHGDPAQHEQRPATFDASGTATTPPATVSPPPPPVLPAAINATSLQRSLSHYEVGNELGKGGMGVVKSALDPALRREIAIKLLLAGDDDDEARRDFLDEAQITGQLEHPNIIPVHELGTDSRGRPYLAMKRVAGRTLAERISEKRMRNRRWQEDAAELLEIFAKICDAIAYAHARGVIHRDLKPANIMIGDFGEVLLMDWGLGKPLAAAGSAPRRSSNRSARGLLPGKISSTAGSVQTDRRDATAELTLAGEVLGTPSFMSPEQARGDTDQVDERSDIFALGAILYALLTLEPPYRDESLEDVVERAARRDLIPVRQRAPQRQVPKELEAIVEMATHPEPRRRYQSAEELKADVQAHLAALPIKARRDPWWTRAAKWARRHPTATMGGTLCVLFGLIVTVLVLQVYTANLQTEAAQQRAEREAAQRAQAQAEAEAERVHAQHETQQRALAQAQAAAATERAEREAAERAQAQAEAHAQRERAAREEAERIAAEERAQRLAGRVRDLLDGEAREAHDEFRTLWDEARAEGIPDETFAASLSEEQHRRFLSAYDELFRRLEEAEVEPSANQCFERGLLRHTFGKPRAAIEDYDRAIELDPEFTIAYGSRGLAHYDLGMWDEAIADLNRAIELDPNYAAAYSNRGLVRRAQGKFAAAIADFNRVIEIDPRSAVAYTNRAMTLADQGRVAEALADYERAIRFNPNYALAFGGRAVLRHIRGDLAGALADFDRAVELDPRNAAFYTNRGAARRDNGDVTGALSDYEHALRLNPKDPITYVNRGVARTDRGDLDGAVEDYSRAIELNPNLVDAYNNRGSAKFDQGQFVAALADFDRTLELEPRHWRAWFNRARVLMQLGRHTDAVESLQNAYRHCNEPAARQQLGEALDQLGAERPSNE